MRWTATASLALALGLVGPDPAAAQPATDIYLFELAEQGGQLTVVGTPIAVTDRDGYDNQPAFTPDGRAILYTSIRDGQADTYRYDLESRVTTRVTATPESEYSPTPLPGTSRFSVVRVEMDSTQRLWSFAADGSRPRLLLPDVAPVGYHAWATPVDLALFILGNPPSLRLVRLDNARPRAIVGDIGRSIQPVPGRNAVSFTQPLESGWWIRELDVDALVVRPLAPLLGDDGYHAWTPSGLLLTAHETRVYQRENTGVGWWREILRLDQTGLGAATRLAVSPTGRWLAVVVDRPTTQ